MHCKSMDWFLCDRHLPIFTVQVFLCMLEVKCTAKHTQSIRYFRGSRRDVFLESLVLKKWKNYKNTENFLAKTKMQHIVGFLTADWFFFNNGNGKRISCTMMMMNCLCGMVDRRKA